LQIGVMLQGHLATDKRTLWDEILNYCSSY
jgi:hypothetical protein